MYALAGTSLYNSFLANIRWSERRVMEKRRLDEVYTVFTLVRLRKGAEEKIKPPRGIGEPMYKTTAAFS